MRHQMRRNEVAELAQRLEFGGHWLADFIFPALRCGKAQTRKPTFLYASTLNPMAQQWIFLETLINRICVPAA